MRLQIAAACLVLSLAALAPPALAAESHGAIAYSPATGSKGWSYSFANRGGAETAALKMCGAYAGDCLVAIGYANACGALAVSSGTAYAGASGTTRKEAEEAALSACTKTSGTQCTVAAWSCSSG